VLLPLLPLLGQKRVRLQDGNEQEQPFARPLQVWPEAGVYCTK
jgi:hypothetical protein